MTLQSSARTLRLSEFDNVVVTLDDIPAGVSLVEIGLTSREAVPAGHKIACGSIGKGEPIMKYGQPIGTASELIEPGCHVHLHNVDVPVRDDLASGLKADGQGEHRNPCATSLKSGQKARGAPADLHVNVEDHDLPSVFQGIARESGLTATRNYIGIVTSVNCSATVADYIAESVRPRLLEYENIDGVVAITHRHGCCQGADDEGMNSLQRTLTGFARHPNFASVLVLGLGCETNQIDLMFEMAELEESDSLRSMTIQEAGGTRATIAKGADMIAEFLPLANAISRQPIPVSELVLGLECGGSDGYSGLSANPALGVASDLLVQRGGTAILSETPEIYGAEHLLLDRCVDSSVAGKLKDLIAWWEVYAEVNGSKINNNPSHGNKEGGLTTIYEKSLGAVAKGGSSPLVDVYQYGERVAKRGFVFMDSPGYDPMSITGQVASGANVLAFTTGRGSVYGCKPVPCIKIATNTPMYQRMAEDMDVNCGSIIDGSASVEEMGKQIFRHIVEIASGCQTKSEAFGFGDQEFVPWVVGAQM